MYKVIILLFYLCFSLSITHYSRTIDALFTHNKRTINALFSSFHYGFMLPKSNAKIQKNLRISKFLENFFGGGICLPIDACCHWLWIHSSGILFGNVNLISDALMHLYRCFYKLHTDAGVSF